MNIKQKDNRGDECSLHTPAVTAVLDKLHRSAKMDHAKFAYRMLPYLFQKLIGRSPSFTDQYRKMPDLSLQFSPEHGIIAYNIARSIRARRIIEFGTAFGFSTIYLAAAIKDNGGGMVIGSEFIEEKAKKAEENLKDAGLARYVEIRRGDAVKSLADPGKEIDMILLDGSKDLYISILRMLAPFLRAGGVVLADNVRSPFIKKTLSYYVAYMQDPQNGYKSITIPLPDGFEFSVKI